MSKRIMAWLLTLVMLMSIWPAEYVMAGDTQASQEAVITVEKVTAMPGDTVKVNVAVSNNPGILGATLKLTYGEGLELTGAENGEAFSKLSLTKPGVFGSPCNFFWGATDIASEDIKDGIILELTFNVSESAEEGAAIPIAVSYESGDILDRNLNEVAVSVTDGSVTIEDFMYGDLNGDKKINTMDVILLSRYIAGGYNVTIDTRAADFNADSKLNTMDVILVSRYIAGGYGVEPPAGRPTVSEKHNLSKVEFKAATCTEDGHMAYWVCADCEKYFSDAEGTHEVSHESVVIPATGHTEEIIPAVEPTEKAG